MAKLGSMLTTFVMAIPLAAVPFMAVYGIPELSVIAEKLAKVRGEQEVAEQDQLQFDNQQNAGQRDSSQLQSASSWEDQLSNVQPSTLPSFVTSVNFESNENRAVSDVNQNRVPFQNTNHQSRSNAQEASTSVQMTRAQVASSEIISRSNQRMTWQSATAQLNHLGIRNFRLEPGSSPTEFLFVCFFTPRENPNTTIRFEAEASEPLKAVELVLQQIQQTLTL